MSGDVYEIRQKNRRHVENLSNNDAAQKPDSYMLNIYTHIWGLL